MPENWYTVRVITDSANKQRWTVLRQSDGLYAIQYAELFREGWRTTAAEGGLTWQEIKARFPDINVPEIK